MAPINPIHTPSTPDIAAVENRVAVALAKRERLIKSWTASTSRPRPPPKTQEELDAEDTDLFRPEPANLGLGAPIPKEFLDGDVKRRELSSNDRLRRLMLGKKPGLSASKPRDGLEKAGSVKRGLKEESSDEEEGRSALGKAKKAKSGLDSTVRATLSREQVKPAYTQSDASGKSQVSLSKIKPDDEQATTAKKPLVDYKSDDDEDDDPGVQNPKNSISPQGLPCQSSISSVPDHSINPPAKATFTFASSNSSKTSRASSSGSDQSEMETAIPLALTPDVVGPTSLPATKSLTTEEAKRAKKRQKRLRKKERDQQQKALAVTNSGATKPQITPNGEPSVAKKLKDRLLDANGN